MSRDQWASVIPELCNVFPELNESPDETLKRLVAEQIALPKPSFDTADLPYSFLDSATFSAYLNSFVSRIPKFKQEQLSPNKIRGFLASELFEQFAFVYLCQDINPPQVILPPNATFEFYKRLYPDNQINHLDSHPAISGASTPDGLLIDSQTYKILTVLEYSLTSDSGYFHRKINAYRINQKKFTCLQKSCLCFVILQDTSVPRNVNQSPKVARLPINKTVWGKFIDIVLNINIPDDTYSHTLADLMKISQNQ